MPEPLLAILEIVLFFILFPVMFKILMVMHIPTMFKKYAVWQIQLFTIFTTIILTYLLTRALIHLIELSITIFT